MTWDLDNGLDGQQSNEAISFHLSIPQTKELSSVAQCFTFFTPFCWDLVTAVMYFSAFHPQISKYSIVLCPVIISLEREVKRAEVNFCKCCTATEHKNQEENPNMLLDLHNFAAMLVFSGWVARAMTLPTVGWHPAHCLLLIRLWLLALGLWWALLWNEMPENGWHL